MLVQLFEARFDPERFGGVATNGGRDDERTAAADEVEVRIRSALDDVASLDHDRILRAFLGLVLATLRTNFFQTDGGPAAGPKPYVSFKLDPTAVPDLPQPRPAFEIFVYSPRVEGVHLRFGKVARGGLRWSDRREDFRTEVLGLVKAQMVKNAVIVPTGRQGRLRRQEPARPGGRPRGVARPRASPATRPSSAGCSTSPTTSSPRS